MNKKEFKERIDSILNADTPELQLKEINKLWGLVKNCNTPPVINSGKSCLKCNDQGWLYDEEGNRTGTCPCHYI